MLRSGRDLYFVQTVSNGQVKEGWVPAAWLVEQGVSRSELDRRPRWGDSTESLDRASSEASEPELKNLSRMAAAQERIKTKTGTFRFGQRSEKQPHHGRKKFMDSLCYTLL